MMRQRCLTAILGIPLAILIVHLGGLPFFAAVLILSLIGMYEFLRILIPKNRGVIQFFAYLCGIAWQVAVFLQLSILPKLLLFSFLGGLIIFIIGFKRLKFQEFAMTILGVVYVFGLFSYLISLRLFTPKGEWWVFFALLLIWSNDTGAFFIGRRFGRHKLHELVSPKKTIEGALGGIMLATGVALFTNFAFHYTSYIEAALLGVLASILSICGDLWESGLKRIAGVKDSGTILPGHGGVLDRFDSLLFTIPVLYYYIHSFILN